LTQETLLTFVGTSCPEETITRAIEMADKASAHLSIVVLAIAPPIYAYGYGMAYGGVPAVSDWSKETKELSDELKSRSDEIERLVQSANISAEVLTEFCETSLLHSCVMRHACVADRVILLENIGLTAEIRDSVISGVIFDSSAGLICGSNSEKVAISSPHVFIAWDSTNHAAAAVRAALPLIAKSKQVTVAVFDPVKREGADGEEPGVDLASWLSRHGCNVTIEQYPSGGDEIANCIIKRASEKGADIVVMGGYGHMKIRQQIFGGTTKSMLEQTKIPVFIAHN
jgi:nucleotide-binding universal stress UspA family protein